MKALTTTFVLSALALAFVPAPAAADVSIYSDTYAAIVYSPKTGKYAYAWNHATRASAERAALRECNANDARVCTWVKFGWTVLVIAEDGAYGAAQVHGEGADSRDAFDNALRELRKHTNARVKTVVVVCSGDVRPKVIVR